MTYWGPLSIKPLGLAPRCDYKAHVGWQVNDGRFSFPKRRRNGATALWNDLNTHAELTNGLTVFTSILVWRQLQVFNSWFQVWTHTTLNVNCKIKNNIDENAVIEFKWYSVMFFKGAPQSDLLVVGWNDGHILRSEIACYIYLMNPSSSLLCFWLYQISLWDFIILVLSSSVDRGLFSFGSQKNFVREVIPTWQMEICGPAQWHGDLPLSWCVTAQGLVASGLLTWAAAGSHHSVCLSAFCCTHSPEPQVRSFDFYFSLIFGLRQNFLGVIIEEQLHKLHTLLCS